MDLEEAYRTYARDIRVAALSQRVMGLDHDDVVAEMTVCLWRAVQTYDGVSRFASYWWSIWLNRRTDLLRRAGARIQPLLSDHDVEPDPEWDQHFPQPPGDPDVAEEVMWAMLAVGYERQDVMRELGFSRRRYYETLHQWRTDQVYDTLRHTP